ncbi:DxFTY motif-containing membrane protein [Spiroplasma endosymbiont of Polydrusus pterygomalis]|uniref:DxFTY motif-containing membrane protein n=1 Tax=Spiroplasma endosymbiont of Polydrusus pterygomalis TaxID=3139327 RepID=UPI003CCAFC17
MKIIKKDNKKESTNNWEHLPPEMQNNLAFHASRTGFWKSFLFLIIEAIGPFLLFFFLTSPDLNFTYHFDVGVGIGFGLAIIVSVFLLTDLDFVLHCHQADQFTYTIALFWALYGIYLTGYWWGWDKILYRCLVSFLFLLIAIFFGTFISVWMRNLRAHFQMKKAQKHSLAPADQKDNKALQDPPCPTKEP